MRSRTFGIEIECNNQSKVRLKQILTPILRKDLKIKGYTHSDGANWEIKPDASLDEGCELASAVLTATKKNFGNIKRIIDTINKDNDKAFACDTGFHVHMDISDVADVFPLYLAWQQFRVYCEKWYPNRVDNNYAESIFCHPRTKANSQGFHLMQEIKGDFEDVFYNPSSNSRHAGTRYDMFLYHRAGKQFVEIRFAEMVSNPHMATGWIKRCMQLVNYVKHFPTVMDYKNHHVTLHAMSRYAPDSLKLTPQENHAFSKARRYNTH